MREIKYEYVSVRLKTIPPTPLNDDYLREGVILRNVYTLDEIQSGTIHLHHIYGGDLYKLLARRQYTGLKDKNGVEIYEGDIVEYTLGEHKWRYQIKWDEYWCEIMAKTIWRNFSTDDETDKYIFEDIFTDEGGITLKQAAGGEVIGNIYENPELLGQSQ